MQLLDKEPVRPGRKRLNRDARKELFLLQSHGFRLRKAFELKKIALSKSTSITTARLSSTRRRQTHMALE